MYAILCLNYLSEVCTYFIVHKYLYMWLHLSRSFSEISLFIVGQNLFNQYSCDIHDETLQYTVSKKMVSGFSN